MELANLHPYVYYATRYDFSKGQTSQLRTCYKSSLYLISKGKGTLHTLGQTYHVESGSLIYIPAGQQHEWVADEKDPMVHICCYFDWSYMNRKTMFDSPSMICYDATQFDSALSGPLFPYPIPKHIKVENLRIWVELFEKFYTSNDYTNERTYMRSLKTQTYFQQFIEYFLNHVLQEENIPDPRMNKLLSQMEQDLMHGHLEPLETYYNELRISRGYFFELFKKATGFSPTQYINHFRIQRAKEDLKFTYLSITEIAEKNHFSSVHYFSRLFRKVTGQTPREFREMEE